MNAIHIALPAVMIQTILRSGICLNPRWGVAFEIARLAEKLPAWARNKSTVPSTVAPNLEAAYRRASEVLEFNASRGRS